MTITITGLTARQCLLADVIWQCDSALQVQAFIDSLKDQDRSDAVAIRTMIIQEYLESNIDEYADQARDYIDRCC